MISAVLRITTMLTGLLFIMGLGGIMLNRRNIIIILMSIELILLAVNLNFIMYSVYLDDLLGQIFAFFVLTVAAAESAIGLAILVAYFRVRGSIAMESLNMMQGLKNGGQKGTTRREPAICEVADDGFGKCAG